MLGRRLAFIAMLVALLLAGPGCVTQAVLGLMKEAGRMPEPRHAFVDCVGVSIAGAQSPHPVARVRMRLADGEVREYVSGRGAFGRMSFSGELPPSEVPVAFDD